MISAASRPSPIQSRASEGARPVRRLWRYSRFSPMRRTPFGIAASMRTASATISCSAVLLPRVSALTALSSSRSSGGSAWRSPDTRPQPGAGMRWPTATSSRRMGGSALDGGLLPGPSWRGPTWRPPSWPLVWLLVWRRNLDRLTHRSPGANDAAHALGGLLRRAFGGRRSWWPVPCSPRSWLGLSWRLVWRLVWRQPLQQAWQPRRHLLRSLGQQARLGP